MTAPRNFLLFMEGWTPAQPRSDRSPALQSRRVRAATLLILLPTAARTQLIPPDFRRLANDRFDRRRRFFLRLAISTFALKRLGCDILQILADAIRLRLLMRRRRHVIRTARLGLSHNPR